MQKRIEAEKWKQRDRSQQMTTLQQQPAIVRYDDVLSDEHVTPIKKEGAKRKILSESKQIDKLNKQYLLLKVKKAQDNYKRELAKLYEETQIQDGPRSQSVQNLREQPSLTGPIQSLNDQFFNRR